MITTPHLCFAAVLIAIVGLAHAAPSPLPGTPINKFGTALPHPARTTANIELVCPSFLGSYHIPVTGERGPIPPGWEAPYPMISQFSLYFTKAELTNFSMFNGRSPHVGVLNIVCTFDGNRQGGLPLRDQLVSKDFTACQKKNPSLWTASQIGNPPITIETCTTGTDRCAVVCNNN